MWRAGLVLSIAALLPSSATAIEQCRFIGPKAEREACYLRQAAELDAKRQRRVKAGVVQSDPDKLENDALNARLRSICRGC